MMLAPVVADVVKGCVYDCVCADDAPANGLLTDLKVYYKFDTNGNDSHTNAKHLTANNTPTFVAGKINNGTNLVRASSQYFNEAAAFDLRALDAGFSISAWVKPTTLVATSGIANFRNGDTTGQWFFWYDAAGRVRFTRWSASLVNVETFTTAASQLAVGVMAHVCVTYSLAGGAKIYVNGTAIATSTTSQGPGWGTTNQLEVGRMYVGSTYHADAIIDEPCIAARAWSAADVTALYNAGAALAYGSFN